MAGQPLLGEIMTVAQVADYLQLNKLTVYKYIREGRLPAVKLGRSFRIIKEDMHSFLEAQKIGHADRARHASRPQPTTGQGIDHPERRALSSNSKEVYVDPRGKAHGQPRETMITYNPLDWVIRGLH